MKMKAQWFFLNSNELSIIRIDAEKKCTLKNQLFRLIVNPRYTSEELFFFKASNLPDDLWFLAESTVKILNNENTRVSQQISYAAFQEVYEDLNSIFHKMCNTSR